MVHDAEDVEAVTLRPRCEEQAAAGVKGQGCNGLVDVGREVGHNSLTTGILSDIYLGGEGGDVG